MLELISPDLILWSILALAFIIQIICWLNYSRVLFYNFPRNEVSPISVIVVVDAGDTEWINGEMSELFAQDHPCYEVVLVNDCGGEELTSLLQMKRIEFPILKFTEIPQDSKFTHTSKVAKLIGIKSASYDNLIFFEPGCRPASKSWLSEMSMAFSSGAETVSGVSIYEDGSNFIRSFSMMSQIRSASASIKKRPYRAPETNFGFTKKIFFESRGYNYLSTGYGDNDLYLQSIANKENFAFISSSPVIGHQPERFKKWLKEIKYSTSTFRFYPFRVKFSVFFELLTTFLLWTILFTTAVYLYLHTDQPLLFPVVVLSAMLVREILVSVIFSKISKKLGETNLLASFLLYDIISPIWEAYLCISRRLGTPSKLW